MSQNDFRNANAMFHLSIPVNVRETVAVRWAPSSGSNRKHKARGNYQRWSKFLIVHLPMVAAYAPVLIRENDRTIIRPMRYACRLAGKPADYDKRFPGTYNARRDSLDDYWSKIYGRNHAVMVISGFYENVPLHLYEHRELAADEKQKNLVLEFNPQPSKDMLVACVWDRWSSPNAPDLYSFAAITDEPTPEVAATGHQRTIITIQERYLAEWLSPTGLSSERLEEMLTDKETPYYLHQIAA